MEEQGLMVVKDNLFIRVTNSIKKFFFKGKLRDHILKDKCDLEKNNLKIKIIENDAEFVQCEILDARRAFRKYVINNTKNISNDILSYIKEKISENENRIRQIIEINKDNISYEEILQLIEDEKDNVEKYKSRDKINGCYNVPIGVIGVECSNAKTAIKNMLKAVSTRNAIIILHDMYNEYSTEALVLLIIKECLKNFYIDDNIIQMFEKEEIDLSKLDKLIKKDGELIKDGSSASIYIYQEDGEFEDDVVNEVTRLKDMEAYKSYSIKPIKGEFSDIINYLNSNDSVAVCMYTNNSQKAYKFINWIKSPNVFVNTGVRNCKNVVNNDCDYFNYKYVLHRDVF